MSAYNDPNQDNTLLNGETPLNARIDRYNSSLETVNNLAGQGQYTPELINNLNITDAAKQRLLNTINNASLLEVKADQLSEISNKNMELLNSSVDKTEELKVISEKNKQQLDPSTPVNFRDLSLDQFMDAYSNTGATNEELASTYFGLRSLDAQEQEKALVERIKAFSSRTPAEVVGDTALSVAKFPTMVGETVYGLANLFTGGQLENAAQIAGGFGQTREFINQFQSDQTRKQREYSQQEFSELSKQEELFRDNTKSFWEKVKSFGREYGEGALILADNPNVLWDTVIESGLAFAVPAAVSNGVRKAVLGGLTAKERNEFLADTAKMNALQKNERLAALLSISALEAGGTSLEVQNTILNTPFEELQQNSKLYNELISNNYTPEDARKYVAANSAINAYAVVAVGAGIVSKVTGSDRLAAELGDVLGTVGNRLFKTARAGAIEGVEESLQSGLGQFGSNVGIRLADNNQSLTESVAGAAGQGGISGAISGAGIQGMVAATQTTGDILQPLVQKGKEIAEESQVVKQVDAAEKAGDYSTLAPKAEDTAFNNLLKIKQLATKIISEDVIDTPEKVNEINTVFNQLQADYENKVLLEEKNRLTNDIKVNPNNHPEIANELAELKNPEATDDTRIAATEKILDYVDNLANQKVSSLYDDDTSDFIRAIDKVGEAFKARVKLNTQKIKEEQELTETEINESVRVFGSNPDSYGLDDIQTFIQSSAFNNLPDRTKNVIKAAAKLKETLVNAEEVSQVINEGGDLNGENWRGIKTYLRQFNSALERGDRKAADATANEIKRWYLTRKDKLAEWVAKPSTKPRQDTIDMMQKENAAMMATMRFMASKLGIQVTDLKAKTNEQNTTTSASTESAQQEVIQPRETEVEQTSAATNTEEVGLEIDTNQVNDTNVVELNSDQVEVTNSENTRAQTGNTAEQSQTATASVDSQAVETNQLNTESVIQEANDHIDNSEITDDGLNESNKEPVKQSLIQKLISDFRGYFFSEKYGKLDFSSFYRMVQPNNKLGQLSNFMGLTSEVINDEFGTYDLDPEGLTRIKSFAQDIINGFSNIDLSVNNEKESVAYFQVKNNPLLVLLDNDNKLPKDVIDTLSLVLLKELATNFNLHKMRNEDSAIKAFFGIDKKTEVSGAVLADARFAGIPVKALMNNLGREVANTLGLMPSKDLDGADYQQATDALAANLLAAGESSRLIERVFVKDPVSGYDVPFIRLKRNDNNNQFNEDSRDLMDLGKDQTDWFVALFNDAELGYLPTNQPVEKVSSKFASDNPLFANQTINKETQEIILKHSQRPNSVNLDFYNYMELLPLEYKEMVAGVIPANLIKDLHVYERDSIQAANEANKRVLADSEAFINSIVNDDGEFSDFFFEHVLWSNGRLGIKGSKVNPQESKFVRHLLNLKSFNTTIDPNNNSQMTMFKAAVGVAFGLKLDQVMDKEINETFDKIINDPTISKFLSKMIDQDWDNVTQEEFYEVLYKGNKNISPENPSLAYHALVGLSEYLIADGGSFNTTLTIEVDGKTNGFAFSTLQFSSETSISTLTSAMERAGVYTTDGMNFKVWKIDQENNDTYEVLADVMTKVAQEIQAEQTEELKPEQKSRQKALAALVGFNVVKEEVDGKTRFLKAYTIGRKLAKNPVMVTMYGAGIQGVIDNFVNDVMNNVYKNLVDLSEGNAVIRAETIRALKALTTEANTITVDIDTNDAAAVQRNSDFTFSREVENDLKDILKDQYQEVMKRSLTRLFGNIADSRDLLVKASQKSYDIFKKIYDIKYEQKLNEVNEALYTKLENEFGGERALEIFNGTKFKSLNKFHIKEIIDTMGKEYPVFKSYYLSTEKSGLVVPKSSNNVNFVESYLKRQGFEIYYENKSGERGTIKHTVTPDGNVTFKQKFNGVVYVNHNGQDFPFYTNKGLNVINYKPKTIKGVKTTATTLFDIYGDDLPKNSLELTVKYKQPVQTKTSSNSGISTSEFNSKTATYNSSTKGFDFVDPSVSIGPKAIHSLDASVQLSVLNKMEAFNVHDAFYYNLNEAVAGASLANQSFVNVNSEFNVFNSAVDMLSKMNLLAMDYGIFNSEDLVLIKDLQAAADKSNKVKKEYFDKVEGVYQYTLNIGKSFNVRENQEAIKGETIIAAMKADSSMGSNPQGINNFVADMELEIAPNNLENVYNVLGAIGQPEVVNMSQEHQGRLNSLVSGLLNPLVMKAKLLVQSTNQETLGTYERKGGDRVIKMQIGSQAPTVLAQSRQEVFVHEIVHAVMELPLALPSVYKKRLEQLYGIAQKYLKPSDLLPPKTNGLPYTKADLAKAEALFDYVFLNTGSQVVKTGLSDTLKTRTVSNGLHEFVAFGLTNENVINALGNLFKNNPSALKEFKQGEQYTPLKGKAKSGFFVKTLNMVNELFNFVAFKVKQLIDKINGLEGKQADEVLYELVKRVAHIERKQNIKPNLIGEKLNVLAANASQYIVQPLAKAMHQSNFKISQAIGGTIRLFPRLNSSIIGNIFNRMVNRYSETKDSLAASLVREMIGRTEDNRNVANLFLMSRFFIDTTRTEVASASSTFIRTAMHRDLTEEESGAFQRALMHTDTSVLFDGDVNNLIGLVGDVSTRVKAIQALEAELEGLNSSNFNFFKYHAENTGHFIVNKRPKYRGDTLLNATQIANLFNLPNVKIDFNIEQATTIIEKLIALHALNFTDTTDLALTANFMKQEVANKNSKSNGVQIFMDLLKLHKKLSLENLFNNEKHAMVAGYVKEIYNPNTGFAVVNTLEKNHLEKQGVDVIGKVPKDKDDTNQTEMWIVKSDSLALNTKSRGAMGLTGMSARGTNLFKAREQVIESPQNALYAADDFANIKARRVGANAALTSGRPFTLGESENAVIPVFNADGYITGYRYMMTENNRMVIAERLDMFDKTFGSMMGSIVDKVNTQKINDMLIQELFSDYKNNYKKNPHMFIKVHANSKDPEVREMWATIPKGTRHNIKQTFGENAVYVTKENYRRVFGFRKATLGDLGLWLDNKFQNTFLEQFGKMAKELLNQKWVGSAESMWKELVTLAKDRIVIVSGSVLLLNLLSNMIVLMVEGINPIKALKYQKEGWEQLKAFQKDGINLRKLKLKLADSTLTNQEIKFVKSQIAQLEDKLTNNPVRPLVDRGVFQSIIEDVEMLDDQFNFATKLEKRLEPITNKIPDVVKDLGSVVFMTKDTSMYQFFRDVTQMSDFAARYTMHRHNLEAGKNFEESLDLIMDTFVNYEEPTHKTIQWLNDVGILMFTKFFIRIQKVALRQLRDKPLNVFGLWGVEGYLGTDLSSIDDSLMSTQNILNRFYSPAATLENAITPGSMHLFQ